MTTGDLADVVLRARDALKNWDAKAAADGLAVILRSALAPLHARDDLPADANEKLEQIDASLDRLAGALTAEQRDALDMLMLGLWIRVELIRGSEMQDS